MKRLAMLAVLVLCVGAKAQRVMPLTAARPGAVPPDVPVADADPSFPVRVHLLAARYGGFAGVYHGYGSGNLLDAQGARGFDFGFECDVPFVTNQREDESYQARWKGPMKLEILTTEVGVDHPHFHACVLRLAMEQKPFEPANTAALSHGVSSALRKPWRDPDFAYEEPTPDYPIRFHAVDGLRQEDELGDHGSGTANLSEPGAPGLVGAEYTYNCSYGFLTNSQLSGFYQARWVKQGGQLEVLLQRPGSDKVDKCLVDLNLRPQTYPESRHIAVPATAQAAVGGGPATP
jgi:hypothetical protein